MMIDTSRDIALENSFVVYEELQEEELQEQEQQFNVYNLNSTVVQSTSSFFDTALDDLPVLDICCLFFFSVCVFFLFNIFNGGNNNVGLN